MYCLTTLYNNPHKLPICNIRKEITTYLFFLGPFSAIQFHLCWSLIDFLENLLKEIVRPLAPHFHRCCFQSYIPSIQRSTFLGTEIKWAIFHTGFVGNSKIFCLQKYFGNNSSNSLELHISISQQQIRRYRIYKIKVPT